MKVRSGSKGKNCYIWNLKDVNSARKAKSIKVSPIASQGNTGCANSPKTSVSPVRSNLNMQNFISNYVTKALVKVEKNNKKRHQ